MFFFINLSSWFLFLLGFDFKNLDVLRYHRNFDIIGRLSFSFRAIFDDIYLLHFR